MEETIVAFQGEPGAYSEEAVIKMFGEVKTYPCRTLSDVFEALAQHKATDGLIPIENSLAGSINESYDLLLLYPFRIFGEVVLPVNHCLLAPKGATLDSIRRVYSHPQALAQCSEFLKELGVEAVAVYDTAGSARMIAMERMEHAAALASERAAELYGLTVLARGVQSRANNYTRFYAIGTREVPRGEKNKTVLVLATAHRPAALFWVLGAFAYRQINLLKLESRPIGDRPWEYLFYLDVAAHMSDSSLVEAISELSTKTVSLRVLGSFPMAT